MSQPYLSLVERGKRRVPQRLALLLAREDTRLATGLRVEPLRSRPGDLPRYLGSLKYPGFEYLAADGDLANPASVLLAALQQPHVAARVTQALPWLLVRFADSGLDLNWLVDQAKLSNLQNRLGYLVTLARQVAERQAQPTVVTRLRDAEERLEDARLAKEDALGRELTDAERRYLRAHRPKEAMHWNLLTNLGVDDLRDAV